MRITGLPWAAKRQVDLSLFALRRTALITRLKVHAFWQRATVDVDISPNVKLGRDVRVTVEPRTRNVIRVGPNCSISDRALFVLKGGRVEICDWVDIRRDTVFTVVGRLLFEGQNLVEHGVAIHCDESVIVRRMVGIGERSTIVDSSHFFTAPDEPFVDNVKTGSVEIGCNTWLGANVTVARNVAIGHHVVIAANSLVLDDVPPCYLASGVPAAVVRRVVPWMDEDDAAPSDRLAD